MATTAPASTPAKKPGKHRKPAKTPRMRKPEGMSLEQWQIALRREFGREQQFRWKNIGGGTVFSDYEVINPQSGRTYRICIHGGNAGDNFCTCPDFTVNTLGTCKHIEFVLGRIERQRGAKAALRQGYLPPFSEVYLRYGARREVAFRAGAECPAELTQLAERYFDARGMLREESFAVFDTFLHEAYKTGHELRCYDDALGFIAQVRDQAALVQRIEQAFPGGVNDAAFDKLLKVPLYEYQRKGALFAARAGRVLLADDMGLGKTIQAIAAVEILARTAGVERVLVVSPTSLKHQWSQEIAKFSGRTARVIEGMSTARKAGYAAASLYKIANYEVIHRDLDLIRQWSPDLIILDEAQRIKNWKTRAARSVKQLVSQHAIVLTGTPLENRLEELHSIVEFVDRFRLGPSFRFLAEHQAVDEDGRVVGYRNLGAISETLKPILIRRTKAEVLKELPQRLEKHLFVPMTPQQQQHHDENKQIVARIVAKWRRYKFLTEADQRRLTVALQNMRMSCNSTYLLDQQTDFGTKADEFISQVSEVLEQPEMKVVVFSQWVRTHELLAARLEKKHQDFVLFHGGVPGPKRKDLIARFKEDDRCRLFLSTDAGGVGLNLQNASALFNMDQPWNPAVLEQRIGRVHRLGQQRPVHVVHFVAKDTIEHAMLGTLQFKRSLFASVLDGGDNDVFLGGSRLKKFMESVEQAAIAIPAAPVQATPLVEIDQREPALAEPAPQPPAATPAAPAAGGIDTRALADLINVGKQFLEGLGAAIAAPSSADAASPLIEHDEKTGRSYLKLPMPAPDALGKLAAILGMLTGKT